MKTTLTIIGTLVAGGSLIYTLGLVAATADHASTVTPPHVVMGDTRGQIRADFAHGQREIRTYYAKQAAKVISDYRKGQIGEGTYSREMDNITNCCNGRLDALQEGCEDRMERFDQ